MFSGLGALGLRGEGFRGLGVQGFRVWVEGSLDYSSYT